MATNYVHDNDRITHELEADAESGDLILLGADNLPAIALSSGSTGDVIALATRGVFSYAVAAGATTTGNGDPAYYDSSEDEITDTTDTGANEQVGVFVRLADGGVGLRIG